MTKHDESWCLSVGLALWANRIPPSYFRRKPVPKIRKRTEERRGAEQGVYGMGFRYGGRLRTLINPPSGCRACMVLGLSICIGCLWSPDNEDPSSVSRLYIPPLPSWRLVPDGHALCVQFSKVSAFPGYLPSLLL